MIRYNIKYSDFHILPVDPPWRCLQISFRRASLALGISHQPRLLFLTSPLSVFVGVRVYVRLRSGRRKRKQSVGVNCERQWMQKTG